MSTFLVLLLLEYVSILQGGGYDSLVLGVESLKVSDKNDFFAPNGQSRVWQRCFEAKYQFLFEMVQKGPDGPKRVPNVQKDLG